MERIHRLRETFKGQPDQPRFVAAAPLEARLGRPDEDDKIRRARHCTDLGMKSGLTAAGYALVASAIPTLALVRYLPWAKQHLNYTAQALIISATSLASYFIVSEQTILECARMLNRREIEIKRALEDERNRA